LNRPVLYDWFHSGRTISGKHPKVSEQPSQMLHQLLFFRIRFYFKHKNSISGFNELYIILGKKLPGFSFETKSQDMAYYF